MIESLSELVSETIDEEILRLCFVLFEIISVIMMNFDISSFEIVSEIFLGNLMK